MIKILPIAILTLSFVSQINAQNNPRPMAADMRIKKVVFQDNNVIPIFGATFTTTQIEFSPHERILDIEGGDSTSWMVTYHPELSNILFIKPTALNSRTNLTVITNLHTYYFALASNKELQTKPTQKTYALKFIYPEVKAKQISAPINLAPKVINSAYTFSGNPTLIPTHVFDDEKFTYFELTKDGIVPAIFAVDDKTGKESTVNTRRQGKYLVVLRIAPQFTLRHNGATASIFNTREITRIAQNRRPQ